MGCQVNTNLLNTKLSTMTDKRLDERAEYRRKKLKELVDRVGLTRLVQENNLKPSRASHISQIVGGYSFGERAAEKLRQELHLPEGYFDLRHSAFEVHGEQPVDRVDELLKSGDGFWETIVYCYPGLSDAHKDVLATIANKMHSIDRPKDKLSSPPGSLTNIKGKDFAQKTFSSTSGESDAHRKSGIHTGKAKQDNR
jgi:hypothetical protein